MSLNESIVEDASLSWFADLGYTTGYGPPLADAGGTLTPALSHVERGSYGEPVLAGRLREAIRRLNPAIPSASSMSPTCMKQDNKKRGNAFRPTSLLKSIVGRASDSIVVFSPPFATPN